jgi:hypothetical protein
MKHNDKTQNKLEAIIQKVRTPSMRVKAEDWGDKSEIICLWGYIEGQKDDQIYVKVGDTLIAIRSKDIMDIEEVDISIPEGEAREVFVKLKATAEIITTVKQGAKLVRMGQATVENVPFALGRPAMSVQVSKVELERQQEKFEKWSEKVGIFEDFQAAKGRSICTLCNTQVWTSAGILDVGTINDGSQGDGCDDY